MCATDNLAAQSALVLDCSGNVISAAVATTDGGEAHRRLDRRHGQAEALAPLVAEVLGAAGFYPGQVPARIVVCRGPGGFTGLRLSAAFALGLAAACDGGTQLTGLGTHNYWRARLYAQDEASEQTATLLIDTRRRDAFLLRLTRHDSGLADWQVVQDVTPQPGGLYCGNSPLLAALPASCVRFEEIDCAFVARLALDARWAAAYLSPTPQPLYVRPPAISVAAKPQRLGATIGA